MPIIHRYLLRNFYHSLVVFFITFTGLYFVIDAFGNLEEFVKHGPKAGGLLKLLAQYYGVRSLVILERTSGVLTLVAAMFTLTALERHNELTALMAAGISRGRLAKPLIGGVLAVCLLAAANREFVIPNFRQQLSTNAQDFSGRARAIKPQYDFQTDVYLAGRQVQWAQKRIEAPRFGLPAKLATYGTRISAESALYQRAKGDRPAGYLMQKVSHPENLERCRNVNLGERPVLLFPADTPWLKPNECFVVSGVGLEQLAGGRNWQRFCSTFELMRALRNPSTEYGPDIRVAVHARLVQPLMDMTLLFLGLPLVLGRESRNIFVAIGMCLGVVSAFFLVVMTCHALGNHCLIAPVTAAWAPLAIFVPVAVAMAEPLRE